MSFFLAVSNWVGYIYGEINSSVDERSQAMTKDEQRPMTPCSVKRSTGHTHTHTLAEHTTAEQTTHTNTERATAKEVHVGVH